MERIWNRNEILGRMNQRIQFQTVTETRSTSGAVTETWAAFATVWAAVDMKAGNESQMLDKQTVKETTEFTIRYRTDINQKMRLVWDNQNYDIVRINIEPERQFIKIDANLYK